MRTLTSLFSGILILLSHNLYPDQNQVYIVGNNVSSDALLWTSNFYGASINQIQLAPTGLPFSLALSLTHMYSVGSDGPTNDGGDAALWISNLDGSSTNKILLVSGDVSNPAAARHVALSPTHLYIAGTDGAASGSALLWIGNLDGSSINQIQLAPTGAEGAQARSLALSSTHVYSVGYDGSHNATLWISNLDGTPISQIQLAPQETYRAGGRAIALTSTHAYIAGNDGYNNATLWITNLDGSSINQIQLAPGGDSEDFSAEAAGIALSPTHVYSVGSDEFNNPTLWITSLDGTSTKQIQLAGNGNSIAEARGLALTSTHVYMAGNDGLGNPTLWISNLDGTSINQIVLSPDGGDQTAAYDVAILRFQSELLLEISNRNSPIVILKGVH